MQVSRVANLPLVVLVLTAALQVQLIDAPIFQIIRKRDNAHFFDKM